MPARSCMSIAEGTASSSSRSASSWLMRPALRSSIRSRIHLGRGRLPTTSVSKGLMPGDVLTL